MPTKYFTIINYKMPIWERERTIKEGKPAPAIKAKNAKIELNPASN